MPDTGLGAVAPSLPEVQLRVRRAATKLCAQHGWATLHEMPLPNGRRADILALGDDGVFTCIEVKSGPRDFLTDQKWPEYREFCDALCFAVDVSFPLALLPEAVGVIVAADGEAELLRPPPRHPLTPARRRALTHRFAMLAACRLAALDDPALTASVRSALRYE